MLIDNQAGLSSEFGTDNSRVVASAYEAALSIVSLGDPTFAPTRDARRAMINAMLGDARQHGFSRDRLTLIAIAAAGGDPAFADA
jgi:hypothetical protein